eukprot:755716-Hanusia_phi.AAC.5
MLRVKPGDADSFGGIKKRGRGGSRDCKAGIRLVVESLHTRNVTVRERKGTIGRDRVPQGAKVGMEMKDQNLLENNYPGPGGEREGGEVGTESVSYPTNAVRLLALHRANAEASFCAMATCVPTPGPPQDLRPGGSPEWREQGPRRSSWDSPAAPGQLPAYETDCTFGTVDVTVPGDGSEFESPSPGPDTGGSEPGGLLA